MKPIVDNDVLLGASAITEFVNELTTTKVSRSQVYHWIESSNLPAAASAQRSLVRRNGSGSILNGSRRARGNQGRDSMAIRSGQAPAQFAHHECQSRC